MQRSAKIQAPIIIHFPVLTTTMTDPAAPSGDLYDLVKLSLLGSELTYAISLMRELGRRKQLASDEDNAAALQMPLQAVEFQRIIERNPGLAEVFEGQNEDAGERCA